MSPKTGLELKVRFAPGVGERLRLSPRGEPLFQALPNPCLRWWTGTGYCLLSSPLNGRILTVEEMWARGIDRFRCYPPEQTSVPPNLLPQPPREVAYARGIQN